MFETIEAMRIAITQFLSVTLVNNSFLFLNLWSFVHFISGGIIMVLLLKYPFFRKRNSLFVLLILLGLWEIVEYPLYTFKLGFAIENRIDIAWDLVLGMFGGIITHNYFNGGKK
ncbi:hypothetical protein HN832_01095 [archaeon]|jgi:hypothetical protein|nr:hypothetical protein [archaeon]MBT4373808.1 hypothetical protein [archaeon]MBT4532274.1 hypothetical protein [archaeon]MBT7001099.1 hypothetical protein [archaeon]MBT7281988.1 hypothetical protein [archaeon]